MRKFIFMMTMLFASLSMSAQHVKESKIFENIYSSISVGATNPTNDWNFVKNVRPEFQLEFGKQVTTYYTTGLNMSTSVNSTGVHTMLDEMSLRWLHKVNLFNVLNGYKNRKFELNPYAGIGWGHEFCTDDDYGVASTGLELNYNISDRFSLVAKPHINWSHISNGLNVNNSHVGVSMGVSYKFKNKGGTRGFQVCNYDEVVIQNEYLNDEVNKLRGQLKDKEDQLEIVGNQYMELKNTPIKPDTIYIDNTITPTVGFTINQYEVTADKMAYLTQIANTYKDCKLIVVGYADKNTGTYKYNKELSRKRAEAVKEVLINMGLNPNNIEVKAMGCSEQPFEDNDMNRVVIIEK